MRALFTIFSAFIFSTAFAQKTEFRIALNSGLSHFAGASAESTSWMLESDVADDGYTNNPYGTKNALCYGISENVKRVTKSNFFFGVDIGLELLRSKILIDKVSSFGMTSSTLYDAEGRTILKSSFVNVNPFLGYRFGVKNFNCDLAGGFDVGYCFNIRENGKATGSDGAVYKTSGIRNPIGFDVRPRIQVGAEYGKFGAYLGYSIGLANYKNDYVGGVNEAYARFFRFGLTYLLK